MKSVEQVTITKKKDDVWRDELNSIVKFTSKLGQIGPKWDKSGSFYDQFQYILARRAKMYWKWSLKSPRFVPSYPIWMSYLTSLELNATWTFSSALLVDWVFCVDSWVNPTPHRLCTVFLETTESYSMTSWLM